MITTRDQLGPIGARQSVSGFYVRPSVEDHGRYVAAVVAVTPGPGYLVAHAQVRERSMRSVGHQDGRIPGCAVCTGMRAAPVRIDRPPERNLALLRHAVDHGLRPHFVEARVERLG